MTMFTMQKHYHIYDNVDFAKALTIRSLKHAIWAQSHLRSNYSSGIVLTCIQGHHLYGIWLSCYKQHHKQKPQKPLGVNLNALLPYSFYHTQVLLWNDLLYIDINGQSCLSMLCSIENTRVIPIEVIIDQHSSGD